MSAVTVSTLYKESVGSLTLHIANIAAGATSLDTWASGIPGIIGSWADANSASNTATNSNGITTLVSGSTIYFRAATTNETMTQIQCFVLSRS